MADVHDSATRSKNMSAIRSKNTKPELLIRQIVHAAGFRFRLHRKDLPGKPDMVFPKYRAVILVHGCFWHGHGCHMFKVPTSRREFWLEKISSNQKRDLRDIKGLVDDGWRVLTIWECAIKGSQRLDVETLTQKITNWIRSERISEDIGSLSNNISSAKNEN